MYKFKKLEEIKEEEIDSFIKANINIILQNEILFNYVYMKGCIDGFSEGYDRCLKSSEEPFLRWEEV